MEADLDPPGMHLVVLYVDDQVLASMLLLSPPDLG